jgi:hypothetical protein
MCDDSPVVPISGNDPCPCGSGKKFKKCHGLVPLEGEGPAGAVPVSPTRPRNNPPMNASAGILRKDDPS